MTHLLDSNVCIELIRRHPELIVRRVEARAIGDLGISAITLAELRYGVSKRRDPERNASLLEDFLLPLIVAPFGRSATTRYGPLRAILERRGRPIGPLDLLIAAHALDLGVTLVTNNTSEFARVEGLVVEDWSLTN